MLVLIVLAAPKGAVVGQTLARNDSMGQTVDSVRNRTWIKSKSLGQL